MHTYIQQGTSEPAHKITAAVRPYTSSTYISLKHDLVCLGLGNAEHIHSPVLYLVLSGRFIVTSSRPPHHAAAPEQTSVQAPRNPSTTQNARRHTAHHTIYMLLLVCSLDYIRSSGSSHRVLRSSPFLSSHKTLP